MELNNITQKGTRDLNMIINAYWDLFSQKSFKPTGREVKLWVRRYRLREKFKIEECKKILS